MKTFVLVSLFALLFACSNEEVATQNFIPGTYSRSVQNEFSEGRDTLIITTLAVDNYRIEHRITYQRITDGKAGVAESKKEYWTALWNEKSGVLTEQKRGRILTFQPDKQTMMVGSSVYRKLN